MKRLIIAVFLIAISSWAYAEPVTVLFTNITAASDGSLKRSETKDHTVFCNYTNVGGSTTALFVSLKGSIDNTTFEKLASHTFSASEIASRSAMFHVLDHPVVSVMGNISSITDTGTTYVGCKYWPHRVTGY